MGQWAPHIFSSTSNWKELKTLLLTLQHLLDEDSESVAGSTLFYFTDNSTTYYIGASGSSTSPGLQALIEQIRHYEYLLRCQLQVIHIPGKAMIAQGTDGLSRGIWASELHPTLDQQQLTASIFAPTPYQPTWTSYYCKLLGWNIEETARAPWWCPF